MTVNILRTAFLSNDHEQLSWIKKDDADSDKPHGALWSSQFFIIYYYKWVDRDNAH